jgi:hypothetical protein
MSVMEIRTAGFEKVRKFMDAFALVADTQNPEHIEMLHAFKVRVTAENIKRYIRERKEKYEEVLLCA